ncbi:MAG: MFS transporter [Alphaproteobacteria bacterium]|nr:MFS transporter [Alphaproteobacteria bacterium]
MGRLAPAVALLFALALLTGLSQFHRSALGVIAPELSADLALSPAMLGAANGMFFGALLIMQLPVGIALDRLGPRLVVAALSAIAVLGLVLQGLATDGTTLLVARALIGIGCAASFMSAVVLCARWYGGGEMTLVLSRVFALSQMGILLAGAPLAWLAGWLGWRAAFLVSALLTGLAALAWWRLVQNDPPDKPAPARKPESLMEALRGQFSIWRLPGLSRVLALHLVAYAAAATVIGLWAGPYFADVHGLGANERGLALAAMGLAMPIGLLLVGPLERRFFPRSAMISAGAALSAAMLVILAVWPTPPLPMALGLLVGLVLFSSYPVLLVTEARMLFPDHLVGRGASTVNMAQVLGSSLLPLLVGLVIGFFPTEEAARPEAAYRAGFALLAGSLLLGLAGWLLLPRAKA